jgi:enoyl-CoA hydratase
MTMVFDLGGVLVDWDPRHLYRKLFPGDPEGMERFLAEICTAEWNAAQDAGRSWADGTALLRARFPDEADRIVAFHQRWEETLAGPIEGSVAILRELKYAGRRLYGLTNWSHETFPIGRARFAFFGWFEAIVVSGEEGIIKPDPRIYRLLMDRHGLAAEQLVYVDDNARNADAAAALGMLSGGFRLSVRTLTFPVPVIIAATGPAIAMGSFLLLSADHRVGAPKSRCQAIEVAIGMTIPISAIEIMRMRLTPAAFERGTALAATFVGDEAIAAGWLDEIVEADQVGARAQQGAQEAASTLHTGAHVATKLKARKPALDAIQAGIDGLATEFSLG